MILATRAVATPLGYGNTVVLKASEQCPRTHAAVARALVDAGLPAARRRPRCGRRADRPPRGPARQLHRLDARGQVIALKCAEHLKRCLLELGGKAPQVVLPDADLEAAADAASFGAFMNSGQICMSTERIVADRSVWPTARASSSPATRATRAR